LIYFGALFCRQRKWIDEFGVFNIRQPKWMTSSRPKCRSRKLQIEYLHVHFAQSILPRIQAKIEIQKCLHTALDYLAPQTHPSETVLSPNLRIAFGGDDRDCAKGWVQLSLA
jgi:hypothetical protein